MPPSRQLLIDARLLRAGATGVGSYTAQLLCALDAIAPAMNVRLQALRLEGSVHWAWEQLHHTEVLTTRTDYEWHPRGDLFQQVGLPRLAHRTGADTILCPSFLAPITSRRGHASVRRVVLVHDLLMEDPAVEMPAGFRRYLRTMVRLALRRCEMIGTSSAIMRRPLAARSGVPTLFLPPAVDHAHFRPRPRVPVLPDGSPRCAPVLVYTGSFEPRKNHALLLASVQPLACELVLLHSGRWSGAPLPAGVRVVAPRNAAEVAAWTSAADLAVFPSQAEGFGIPLLEAMACGTPLVASDIPAARWLSGGGRSALLLPPDDVAAWTHALDRLLRGEDAAVGSRVAAGLRRAAGFAWHRSARRLLQALYGAVAPLKS